MRGSRQSPGPCQAGQVHGPAGPGRLVTSAAAGPASRAPFGWYGSKARLAGRITKLAARIPHKVYIEPYAGSAAVLFRKPRARVEVLNDLDGGVVNYFRMLRDHGPDLARACQLTPYARDEYADAAARDDDATDIERARRFWARCMQSFNNAGAGRRAGWAISTAPGSNDAVTAARLAAQLEQIAARLAGVYIENGDALDLITRRARGDALLYIDPPYLAATRTGRERSRQGDYQHEYTEDDHRALAAVLHATPAAVLLSGYDHPLYAALYPGWHRYSFRVARPSANHSASATRHATEVIWSNRPVDDGALFPP